MTQYTVSDHHLIEDPCNNYGSVILQPVGKSFDHTPYPYTLLYYITSGDENVLDGTNNTRSGMHCASDMSFITE
jgi:hypothetical protein